MPNNYVLTVEAKTENLPQVLAFVDEYLEQAGCSMKVQMALDVAVEELFVNIANYAYAPGTGSAVISVRTENGSFVIEFRDAGVPYDPTLKPDPDVSLSAADRPIGGLGIYMAKKSTDSMSYRYEDGHNILEIRKKI